jgi:hypothetical protein
VPSSYDWGFAVREDPDGSFIVAGTGYENGYVYKLDKFGRKVWSALLSDNGIMPDQALLYSVEIVTSDPKGYVVVGISHFSNDLLLVRFDESGNVVWKKNIMFKNFAISGCSFSQIHTMSINETQDGGYIIAAPSRYEGYLAIIKFSKDGELVLMKELKVTGGVLIPNEVIETVDADHNPDGYIATGYNQLYLKPREFMVIRVNLNGEILWKSKVLDSYGEGYSIIQSFNDQNEPDGFVVSGVSTIKSYLTDPYPSSPSFCRQQAEISNTSDYAVLVKFDNYGSIVNGVAFSGLIKSSAYACTAQPAKGSTVEQTADGGYAVAGKIFGDISDGIFLTKLNDFKSGTTKYDITDFSVKKVFSEKNKSSPPSGSLLYPLFQPTSDGGYIIVNTGIPTSAYSGEVGLIKTDENGETKDDGDCPSMHLATDFGPAQYYNLMGSEINWPASSTDFAVTPLPEELMVVADAVGNKEVLIENYPLNPLVINCTTPPAYCASANYNVSGFAWSSAVGWISTNCGDLSVEAEVDYGLDINESTGLFSGYAWSSNLGWISFNSSELGDCPEDDCLAKVDLSTGKVSGWARACSVFVSGCSGPLLGGWDGWIKLGDDTGIWQPSGGQQVFIDSENYDIDNYSEFKNWAWGGDVVGWLSFNSKDCDTNGNGYIDIACGGSDNPTTPVSDYKVITDVEVNRNSPPVAQMSCDPNNVLTCTGCTCNVFSWISYHANSLLNPCVYNIKNNSTDPEGVGDIVSSKWYIKDSGSPVSSYVLKNSCSGLCDYAIQQDVAPGNYDLKLYVEDSGGLYSETVHSLIIRREIVADFMCSLDNVNWKDCNDGSIKAVQNQKIYLKDDASLAKYSIASEGASISLRQWTNNGVSFGSGSANPSLILTNPSNIVRLTVLDSAGRSNYKNYTIAASLPLPEWKEVPPTGFIEKFLATISAFLKF